MGLIDKIGVVASVVLPLFNIPLILKVIKRKSSEDISLTWALGVWVCFLFMFPSGLRSEEVVFRTFTIVNIIFFTAVVFVAVKYRKGSIHGK